MNFLANSIYPKAIKALRVASVCDFWDIFCLMRLLTDQIQFCFLDVLITSP